MDPGRVRPLPGHARMDPGRVRPLSGHAWMDPGRVRPLSGHARMDRGRVRPLPGHTWMDPSRVRPLPGDARTEIDSVSHPPERARVHLDGVPSAHGQVEEAKQPLREPLRLLLGDEVAAVRSHVAFQALRGVPKLLRQVRLPRGATVFRGIAVQARDG